MIELFSKHKMAVRASLESDIQTVAAKMRKADVDEIWASHLVLPYDALKIGLKHSKICDTVLRGGQPVGMYGLVPHPELKDSASIWFLGTDELLKSPHAFGKMSRIIIRDLWEMYPVLYNYVDVRNKKSIAWLKACGASFTDPAPYGIAKLPFMYFQLRKG